MLQKHNTKSFLPLFHHSLLTQGERDQDRTYFTGHCKKKKKKKRHKNCFLVAIRDAHGVLQAYSREPAFTASDKVQETARNSKII